MLTRYRAKLRPTLRPRKVSEIKRKQKPAPHPLVQLTRILSKCGKPLKSPYTADGRLNSAFQETAVIASLQKVLPEKALTVPKLRHWYDIAYHTKRATYYINIKISNGGCDNAFNKKAIVYSLSSLSEDRIPNTMSFNTLYDLIYNYPLDVRTPEKEYYYLYIDKLDGSVFARSICDISYWVSNPTNTLQIQWSKEKKKKHLQNSQRAQLIEEVRERIIGSIRMSLQKHRALSSRFFD